LATSQNWGWGRKKKKKTLGGQTCLINTWHEWRGKNKIIQHLDVIMHNIQNSWNMDK
jgi:hypothetical protein